MTEPKIYFDLFDGPESVECRFDAPGSLDGATVLYASYSYEDYEGHAWVVFTRDGKLWEVVASHCSCYGLEGQWKPEETLWAAIAMRDPAFYPASGIELAKREAEREKDIQ